MNVLISCPQMQRSLPAFSERLTRAGIVVESPRVEQALSEQELFTILPRFDGIIAGDDHLTGRVLRASPRLRVISKWGVGVDGIDQDVARELGIVIFNTPGAFDDAVADVCIGYLIMLTRHLHSIDTAVRSGEWSKPVGTGLAGKRIGLIGLGGIGLAVARRASAMRMGVAGFDVSESSMRRASAMDVLPLALHDLLTTSDVISLHCPLTADNIDMLDASALQCTRPGVIIINTARGRLIDVDALALAVVAGRVAGAALDVFPEEPLPNTSRLASLPNVILGSHNASNVLEASHAASERAVANLFVGLGIT
jgi:D-3-phosphoglycerate dehydrogenase